MCTGHRLNLIHIGAHGPAIADGCGGFGGPKTGCGTLTRGGCGALTRVGCGALNRVGGCALNRVGGGAFDMGPCFGGGGGTTVTCGRAGSCGAAAEAAWMWH